MARTASRETRRATVVDGRRHSRAVFVDVRSTEELAVNEESFFLFPPPGERNSRRRELPLEE